VFIMRGTFESFGLGLGLGIYWEFVVEITFTRK
jgi:hypothetical protein